MASDASTGTFLQGLERILAVIRTFSTDASLLTLSEVARTVGITPAASCSRWKSSATSEATAAAVCVDPQTGRAVSGGRSGTEERVVVHCALTSRLHLPPECPDHLRRDPTTTRSSVRR